MENSKEKGITLIALIITIIVLLILAGVSISMVIGDNGILTQAVNASAATDIADTYEQIEMTLLNYLNNNGEYSEDDVWSAVNDVLGTDAERDTNTFTVQTSKNNTVDISDLIKGASDYVERISTTESYVGYYADIDSDGEVDGIIYADLMFSQSGTYGTNNSYSYDAIDNSKAYYISEYDYEDDFGTADVITLVDGNTGNDRFYVMALNDFTANGYSAFYWYYEAYSNGMTDYSTDTSVEFGTGKDNTTSMIEKWNEKKYGDNNSKDIWGVIQTQDESGYSVIDYGWFIPSRGEWSAFGDAFDIDPDNYEDYGIYYLYWSSSQRNSLSAYRTLFNNPDIGSNLIKNCTDHIRLSTTF